MTTDREIREMLTSGIGPSAPQEHMVEMVVDGRRDTVPVSLATYLMMGNLVQGLREVAMRLDALHAHAAGGAHPNSKAAKACVICTAQNMTPEQIEELKQQIAKQQDAENAQQQDANVVAGGVAAGAETPGIG